MGLGVSSEMHSNKNWSKRVLTRRIFTFLNQRATFAETETALKIEKKKVEMQRMGSRHCAVTAVKEQHQLL